LVLKVERVEALLPIAYFLSSQDYWIAPLGCVWFRMRGKNRKEIV